MSQDPSAKPSPTIVAPPSTPSTPSTLSTLPNPFRDRIVHDAWQEPPSDLEEIHRDVSDACLAGIEAASRSEPDSLLVHGGAGAGKTHLLARVQRHLTATRREAPDKALRCVFVYLRLQSHPNMLWQHVRRRLANDLMRTDEGLTQLKRLVAHQIGLRSGQGPRVPVVQLRVALHDAESVRGEVEAVAAELGWPRDLSLVIEHLATDRRLRDARAWLAGDPLPEAALEAMGLVEDREAERESVAREVVLGLSRLAAPTLPIVYCFDQVEALQRSAHDTDAFFRFGRVAADLQDADPNVFLLTCLQTALLPAFRAAVRTSDYDRLARREKGIAPLEPDEARRLVVARLARAREVAELRAARRASAAFPFDERDLDRLAAVRPLVPRRVLEAAAQRFEELQSGAPPPPLDPGTFLTATLDERLPEVAEQLGEGEVRQAFMRGVEVLSVLEHVEVEPPTTGRPPEIDVVLARRRTASPPTGQQVERVAVSVRDEADGRSLSPRLKALVGYQREAHERAPAAEARVVVLRDPRLPISERAIKVREHLSELRAHGAELVEPRVEALAALSTMATILGDAKSGDLAVGGEPIGEGVVLAWLRSLGARGSRLAEVEGLVEALFARAEPSAALEHERAITDRLAEALAEEKLVPLDVLASKVGVASERVAAAARSAPDRFLVLEGPPALVIDVAGVVAERREP
jgi:hypothetical protein